MPKKPIDYSKAMVYRLIYNYITYYVGSTTNMCKRKARHKYNTNGEKSDKYYMDLYIFIRANGGWDNWQMIQIETYPDCKSSEELRMHERFHYDIYKPSLNSQLPYITEEEKVESQRELGVQWREENKEKIVIDKADYYQENKERLLEKQNKYYTENIERCKQYYLDNIKEINDKKKERCMCECGVEYARRHKVVHQQTKKHINLMNQKLVMSTNMTA